MGKRKYNIETESYQCNEVNIFSEYDNEEDLRRAYRAFVRENGTSTFINRHFTLRMNELDMIYNANASSKELLAKRRDEIGYTHLS